MKQDVTFNNWNDFKQSLHAKIHAPYYKEREVWFAAIGHNIGYEENGKNSQFERPLVIIKKFNKHIFIGVPLSTIIKEHNRHYFVIHQNGVKRSAMISHIRLYSSKRLLRRMFIMDEVEFVSLCEAVRGQIIPTTDVIEAKKTDPAFTESSGPEGIYTSNVANTDKPVKRVIKKSDPAYARSSEPEGHFTSILTQNDRVITNQCERQPA